MFKSKYGPITNPRTGESKDIVVSFCNFKNFKDILIGGGIVLIGIAYLTLSTFKNGSEAFEDAEFKTLDELDLFGKSNGQKE